MLEALGVKEARMRLHGNHRTCPSSRLLMCRRVLEQEWTVLEAAQAAGCSPRTVWKWLARYRAGDVELVDRSSRPKRSPARLSADRVGAIEALRRVWMSAAEISEALKIPLSTVSVWLKRIGLGQTLALGTDRADRALRARHSRRARPCRYQTALTDLCSRWRPPCARTPAQQRQAKRQRPQDRRHWLRIRARDDR